jgi:hypothetical protein
MSSKPAEEIPIKVFREAFNDAQKLLNDCSYSFDVTVRDLKEYSRADTFYPSAISWNQILQNRLIVVHEIVEIAELKRMGLRITRDVIVRNIEHVYHAHLKATEIELEIAIAAGDYDHIAERLNVIDDWNNDPMVPASLKKDYERLSIRAKQLLSGRDC